MSLWKKTMDYLGLGPDDAYDDYDDYDEPAPAPKQGRGQRDAEARGSSGANGVSAQRGWDADADDPAVRTVSARPSYPSRDFDASSARRTAGNGASGRSDDSGVQVRPNPQSQSNSLRTVPGGSMEPHTVRPRRFDQAQEVADKFKDGQPVIMNLEGTEREVARRLIDFASGICYALDGSMEKVATGVYLLKPPVAQRTPRYDEYDD
jgi:cell division inhibitor SepF